MKNLLQTAVDVNLEMAHAHELKGVDLANPSCTVSFFLFLFLFYFSIFSLHLCFFFFFFHIPIIVRLEDYGKNAND